MTITDIPMMMRAVEIMALPVISMGITTMEAEVYVRFCHPVGNRC